MLTDFAPFKTSKMKSKNKKPQWFNREIAKAINKRNRLHRAWCKNKSNVKARERFVTARKKCELAIRQSKKLLYMNKFNSCIGDSRQTFELLNELQGKLGKESDGINVIEDGNGNKVQTKPLIANELNSYFTNIGPNLASLVRDTSSLPNFATASTSILVYDVTSHEINEIIHQLKSKASSGYDNISSCIIKACKNTIIHHLMVLINRSLKNAVFPSSLAYAKVIPLHKGGSKLVIDNYRPISLLTVWSKIL